MAGGLQTAGLTVNQMKGDGVGTPGTAGDASEKTPVPHNDDYWLLVARDAYTKSDDYYEANIRSNHARNMAHFQGRHAPGSKYYSEAYRYRHKGFRPKTRSMVRRQESALVKAMFSTSDFVTVKAARGKHPSHRVSASINQKLLQYRLENTIPWFLTTVGAYQDTLNLGVCISHQYWDWEEEGFPKAVDLEDSFTDEGPMAAKDRQETIDEGSETSTADANTSDAALAGRVSDGMDDNIIEIDFDGDEDEEEERPQIIRDTPMVDLRPCENVRFSVGCDWRDPANSSPFIIDQIPMYIDDVKRMAMPHKAGNRQTWYALTDAQLLTGVNPDYDAVRRQREENREDSKDERYLHRGFDIVWVHRNIIRKEGVDWIYYTLGTHYRLSDPIPLREDPMYRWLRPGERPYIIGYSNAEAHKNYPESLVGLSSRTQQDANELNNTRFDNVELSLNRRYIVKRTAMIDYSGLQRNVPGGVTETDDPTNDIKMENPPDVTASSYQEQDRINADFDELVGMFSGSSIGTNRQMNETVGGMKLLAGDADSLTEYPMMVFMITWVLPVLRQIVRLEQHYESDGALLNLMGEDLNLWQKYKIDRVTDAWIQGSMNIQVAANFGAANPEQRIQRLAAGFGIIFNMAPTMQQKFDAMEFSKEVLGALGYQGTERFFPEKPQVAGAPQPNEGELTEQDQAKHDQEYQMHLDRMDWEKEKFMLELQNKEYERVLKGELSQQQFEEKMTRIRVDRQNKVDEMKIKLREGSGI